MEMESLSWKALDREGEREQRKEERERGSSKEEEERNRKRRGICFPRLTDFETARSWAWREREKDRED